MYGMFLFHDRAVGIEQRQFFQINQIRPILGIAFCQDSHAAADDAACLFYQNFQCLQAFAGGDHIVNDEDLLAFHEFGVSTVQV